MSARRLTGVPRSRRSPAHREVRAQVERLAVPRPHRRSVAGAAGRIAPVEEEQRPWCRGAARDRASAPPRRSGRHGRAPSRARRRRGSTVGRPAPAGQGAPSRPAGSGGRRGRRRTRGRPGGRSSRAGGRSPRRWRTACGASADLRCRSRRSPSSATSCGSGTAVAARRAEPIAPSQPPASRLDACLLLEREDVSGEERERCPHVRSRARGVLRRAPAWPARHAPRQPARVSRPPRSAPAAWPRSPPGGRRSAHVHRRCARRTTGSA